MGYLSFEKHYFSSCCIFFLNDTTLKSLKVLNVEEPYKANEKDLPAFAISIWIVEDLTVFANCSFDVSTLYPFLLPGWYGADVVSVPVMAYINNILSLRCPIPFWISSHAFCGALLWPG